MKREHLTSGWSRDENVTKEMSWKKENIYKSTRMRTYS